MAVSRVGGGTAVAISTLIGFMAASLFFAYHAPGATEVSLGETIGLSTSDVGWLFTAYSLPNTFMPVLAGLAIDRYGLKPVAIVLQWTITIGSIVYAAGTTFGTTKHGIMMWFISGRVIIGLAAESMITWSQSAALYWFSGPHESKAMGTTFAVQNGFGSAASFFVLQWIEGQSTLGFANWFVVMFCCFSNILFLIYCWMEGTFSEYLRVEQNREVITWGCRRRAQSPLTGSLQSPEIESQETVTAGEQQQKQEQQPPRGCLAAIRAFPTAFWLENLVIVTSVSILYVSANFFPKLLVKEYGMTKMDAGVCSALIYGMTLLAPIFGAIVDAKGKRLVVQTLSIFFAIVGFTLFYLTSLSPWLLVPFCGLCFAWMEQNCYCLLGRCFQLMEFDASGVGYGIMGTFLNSGLMVIPPVLGSLMDSMGDRVQSLVYVGSLSLGFIISLAIFAVDKDGTLNAKGEASVVPTTPLSRAPSSDLLSQGSVRSRR